MKFMNTKLEAKLSYKNSEFSSMPKALIMSCLVIGGSVFTNPSLSCSHEILVDNEPYLARQVMQTPNRSLPFTDDGVENRTDNIKLATACQFAEYKKIHSQRHLEKSDWQDISRHLHAAQYLCSIVPTSSRDDDYYRFHGKILLDLSFFKVHGVVPSDLPDQLLTINKALKVLNSIDHLTKSDRERRKILHRVKKERSSSTPAPSRTPFKLGL